MYLVVLTIDGRSKKIKNDYSSTINSHQSPCWSPAAFPSSTSICISKAKRSSTLITTSSNTSALIPFVFTFTICPLWTQKSWASATLIWICLFATIRPCFRSTSSAGPIKVIASDPSRSLDSLKVEMGYCERIKTATYFLIDFSRSWAAVSNLFSQGIYNSSGFWRYCCSV